MDRLTPAQRRKNMQRIKAKNTGIEKILCHVLWERGVRYRKNVKDILGKPDIAIKKYKIAVFCDSEFFHGFEWDSLKEQLEKGSNSEFWIKKIQRNMERDNEVTAELQKAGWTVLRFWGKEIKKQPEKCADTIVNEIERLKNV